MNSPPSPTPVRTSRWRCWALRLGLGLAALLTFVVSLLLGLWLHLNSPAVRASIAEIANTALADVLYGQIRIGVIEHLSPAGVTVRELSLADEAGNVVLALEGVRVRADVVQLVRDVWLATDKLDVVLSHVRAERSEVRVIPDPATGDPTLARAFTERPSARAPSASTRPSRPVRVWLPTIELGAVRGELGLPGWEDISVHLARVQASVLFSPKGVALDVERFGTVVDGFRDMRLRGTGSFVLRAPGPMRFEFSGFAGDTEVEAHLGLNRGVLDFELSTPRVEPQAFAEWFGAWPVRDPISGKLRATGKLPYLETRTELRVGPGRITAEGPVDLADGVAAQLRVDGDDLSPSSVIEGLDARPFDITSQIDVRVDDDGYRVELGGLTEPSEIQGIPVPSTRFDLIVSPEAIEGSIDLYEPAARTRTHGRYANERLDLNAKVPTLDLARQRRVPLGGTRGLVALEADLTWQGTDLKLSAKGRLARFRLAPVEAEHADFTLTARAASDRLNDARLDLDVDARQLTVGPLHYDRARLRAFGGRTGANFDVNLEAHDGRSVAARGYLHPDFSLTKTEFTARRRDLSLSGKLRRFDWNAKVVHLPELSVRGPAGSLDGHLLWQPQLVEGAFSASKLRVDRIAAAFGAGSFPLRGSFDFDTKFTLSEELERAELNATVTDLSVQNWGNSDVTLTVTLDQRNIGGSIRGSDALGFSIRGNWNGQLAGPPLEFASYTGITGTSELGILGVPLKPLAFLAPPNTSTALDGKVGVRALLQRVEPDSPPNAFVEIGLVVDHAEFIVSHRPHRLDQLSTYLSTAFDAKEKRLNGVATVSDAEGRLLNANLAVDLDVVRWLEDPTAALSEFRTTPLSAAIQLPRRSLSGLPFVKEAGLHGYVEAQLALYGSLTEPRCSILLDADEILAPGLERTPLTINLNGQYAPSPGDFDLKVLGSAAGRTLLLGRVAGQAPLDSMDAGEGWSASARADLDRLPLNLIAPLVDYEIDGAISGKLELTHTDAPKLTASFEFENLSSGRAVLGNSTLLAKGEPGRILASFSTKDTRRPLSVILSAGARSPQVPLPNQIETLDVALRARRLDAAALGPMLEAVVARTSGDVDADLTLFARRTASTEPGVPPRWHSAIEGSARLSDGSAYVDALGLELRDVALELSAAPRGEHTEITVERLRAKARSEQHNLEGQAQFLLTGTELQRGTAALRLRSVPLTLQGLSLGKARGQVLAKFERGTGWDVQDQWQGKDFMHVDLELLDWKLQATPSASRQLIDLSSHSDVVVLQYAKPEPPDPDLLPLRLTIRIDDEASFNLSDIEMPLRGVLQVDVTDSSRLSGTIELRPGGRVPIFGRVFRVVDGRLVLNPRDPSNPTIDVRLTGRSAKDEIVNVTLSGTLQEPHIEPDPAALQALLGGGAATALGSGVQVLGINQLLGNSVQFRVSSASEEDEEATYGASVQIGENLWFEASYQRNQDASLNRKHDEVLSGTLDYRFRNDWSLRTKVGNTGGSVDLLWQYRY